MDELSRCLGACLNEANCGIGQKFSKIRAAALIDKALSIDNGTLTPSLKVAPKKVAELYRDKIAELYDERAVGDGDVFIIRLDSREAAALNQKAENDNVRG